MAKGKGRNLPPARKRQYDFSKRRLRQDFKCPTAEDIQEEMRRKAQKNTG